MKITPPAQRRANKTGTADRVALGFRAHSGWAVLVAVAGPLHSPAVVDRRRIELADPAISCAKQPYHAAAELKPSEAKKLLRRCTNRTVLLARRAVRGAIAQLREKGHSIAGCGLVLASGRPLPGLAATLGSHALIHTAEGELFREALARASKHCRLALTRVRERDLLTEGTSRLRLAESELRRRLNEMGQSIGPPWRQDEKLASLVAWLALSAASKK